jgi:hydroxymethylpyrimidine pyrophosphatase-like HAD family hydrolase
MSSDPIKLVAIDLDGTLLTTDKEIAPQGASWIRAASEAGVQVVLATTRNPDNVQAYCDQQGLYTPMICTNGAQVWGSPDGPEWLRYTIPRTAAVEIAQMADDAGWELATTVEEVTHWRQRPGQAHGPIFKPCASCCLQSGWHCG